MPHPAPLNLITDLPGLTVGHAACARTRSGVTTLFCDRPWVAAVDVRGGGPGLRETEALAPENLVGAVDAIVFAGGSVFGLAAADGVVAVLSAAGRGLHLKQNAPAIPIVPGAVLHDLGNGGDKDWGLEPPYRRLGIDSVADARRDFALGAVGAGLGAGAGIFPGGIGSTSIDLGDGLIVAALVAANPIGSVYMPDGETFWAWPFEIDGEFGGHRPGALAPVSEPVPDLSILGALGRTQAGANTTLAVVASTADLSAAECKRVAMMAQDGMARAVRPAHTPFDGDVVFAITSGTHALGQGNQRHVDIGRIGSAAADCLARAIARGVYAARP